jgi:phage replication O-like protein O
MANPQRENGYTSISNEILEALCGIRIPGTCYQCLNVILRKTYGFQKKEDKISLSQFCLLSKMTKSLVCKSLRKLEKMNLIIVQKDNEKITLYRFNKDFDTWKSLSKKTQGVSKKTMTIVQKDNASLSKRRHTKENDTKETLTKDFSALRAGASPVNRDELVYGSIENSTPVGGTQKSDFVKGGKKSNSQEINAVFFPFYEKNPLFNFGHRGYRVSAEKLIKQFGLEQAVLLAQQAVECQGELYAPTITDPTQLINNFGKLQTYYARKESEDSKPKKQMFFTDRI